MGAGKRIAERMQAEHERKNPPQAACNALQAQVSGEMGWKCPKCNAHVVAGRKTCPDCSPFPDPGVSRTKQYKCVKCGVSMTGGVIWAGGHTCWDCYQEKIGRDGCEG